MEKVLTRWLDELRKFLRNESELRNRALITLHFKPSLIRIGSGREIGPEARLKIAKVIIGDEELSIIPESSWRGTLRRIGESIAKASLESFRNALDRKFVQIHVEPEEGPIFHEIELEELRTMHKVLKEDVDEQSRRIALRFISEDALTRREPNPREYSQLLAPLCPICRLFGGPGLRSKLMIADTLLRVQVYDRTHVSLDRMTGVRKEGHLFTAEYAFPTEDVELKIVAHNVDPGSGEALILAGVLDWILKLGLEVGGFKSRGIGHLELASGDVIFIDYESTSPERLLQALISPEEFGRRVSVEEYVERLRQP